MSLDPSLALIPCAFDTGKLYSVLPEDGSGDFTVSRNGTAAYFDKDGILRTAQAHEPRFDFDPVTGEFKGILVQQSATNLWRQSEPTGPISAFNTIDVVENDWGIGLSKKMILDNQNNTRTSTMFLNLNLVEGQIYTLIFLARNQDGSLISLGQGNNVGLSISPEINSGGVPLQSIFSRVELFKNDIYLCKAVITALSSVSNTGIRKRNLMNPVPTEIGAVSIYFGDQRHLGLTSYIPTSGSQVTRPADIITVEEPVGISEIKTTLNGTESTITPTGGTYQLPNGHVSRVLML
jgi:hypothetical protein